MDTLPSERVDRIHDYLDRLHDLTGRDHLPEDPAVRALVFAAAREVVQLRAGGGLR